MPPRGKVKPKAKPAPDIRRITGGFQATVPGPKPPERPRRPLNQGPEPKKKGTSKPRRSKLGPAPKRPVAPRRLAPLGPKKYAALGPPVPLDFLGRAFGEGANILKGLPAGVATLGYAAGYDLAHGPGAPIFGARPSKLLKDVGKPLGYYYKGRYYDPIAEKGLGSGLAEIGREWWKAPVSGTLDLAAGVGAGARVGNVGKLTAETGSLRKGFRGSYHPSTLPGHKPRTVRIGEFEQALPESRHPMMRWAQGYRDAHRSEKSKAKVVTKAHERQLVTARRAELARARDDIQAIRGLGGRTRKTLARVSFGAVRQAPLRTRLYWEYQLPAEMRGNVGLAAIRTDLQGKLAGTSGRTAQALHARIKELDAAIKAKPNGDYVRAMEAMETLGEMREQILGSIFGARFENLGERFALRSSILPEHLFGGAGSGKVLYHGSPEGLVTAIDPTLHTQVWKEGIGFYITESQEKAGSYAKGRTARGERKQVAGEKGAITPVRLSPNARVLDMDLPADLPLWRDLAEGFGYGSKDFERYVLGNAGSKPTNARLRTELLSALRDEVGGEAMYALEEGLGRVGIQATTHLEGLKTGKPHRVWVVKDPAVLEIAQGAPTSPGGYIPHVGAPLNKGGVGTPGIPTSQVVGKTSLAGTGLGPRQQNRLVRYERGELLTDPDLVVQAWAKTQSVQFLTRIKEFLHATSEPIGPEGIKQGHYLVNLEGKPISPWWRDDLKNDVLEHWRSTESAAEIGDEAALAKSLTSYLHNFLAEAGDEGVARLAASGGEVRQLRPEIVHQLYSRLGGVGRGYKTGPGAQTVDVLNGLVKASLLYLNPAYIPANLVGNMVFLGLHRGPLAIGDLYQSGRIATSNRQLWNELVAQEGHGPSMAVAGGAAGGIKPVRAVNQGTRALARVVGSIPDNWPRIAAFIGTARQAGIKGDKALLDLLRNPEKANQLMNIRHQATEAMVNFERLAPWERDVLSRVFFVWPWIRGATAWVGHYSAHYPERAAVLGTLAQQQQAENEAVLGQLPAMIEGAIPLGPVQNGVVQILPTQSLSPTSTLLGLAETGQAVGESIAKDKPFPRFREPLGYVNPWFESAYQLLRGENEFAQKIGTQESLAEQGRTLSPAYRLGKELVAGPKPGGLYADRNRLEILERRLRGRARINVKRANELAREKKTLPRSKASYVKSMREMQAARKWFRAHGNAAAANRLYPEAQADLLWSYHLHSAVDELADREGVKSSGKLPWKRKAPVAAALFVSRFPWAEERIDALLASIQTELDAKDVYDDIVSAGTESYGKWTKEAPDSLERADYAVKRKVGK